MPEKAPAFQFYPKDFLTDEKVSMMSDAELGKYIRLLCMDWINGGIPEEMLKGSVRVVTECFKPLTGKVGYYSNPRLVKEREKQAAWRAKCAAGGRKSRKSTTCEDKGSYKGSSSNLVRPLQVNCNSSSPSPDGDPPSGGSSRTHAREEAVCVNAREIPSIEQVKGYFANAGVPEAWAQDFFDHYDGLGWMGPGNRPIAKWQSFAGKWITTNRSGRAPGKQAEINGRRGGGTDF